MNSAPLLSLNNAVTTCCGMPKYSNKDQKKRIIFPTSQATTHSALVDSMCYCLLEFCFIAY